MRHGKKIISADIGGTNSRFAVIDENYHIQKSLTKRTILYKKDEFVTSIVEAIREIGGDFADIAALSLGIPGPIGPGEYVIDLPNIHIQDIPLGDILRQAFGLPVFIRNDAEMACFAEAISGSGKDYHRVFFITISTGLGGALVVDKSFKETPLEIGHTPYSYKGIDKYFEYFASGTGLTNLAKIHDLNIKDSQQLFDLVTKRDSRALIVYHEWLRIIGDFLNYIKLHHHPDVITITGGVFKSKDIFWRDLLSLDKDLNITACHYDQNAGLIGAASYGLTMLND